MPQISPFRGLRYDLDTVGASLDVLTAPPYDVIDDEERTALELAHPCNAVRLILPRDGTPGGAAQGAARTFADWRERGILREEAASLYAYDIDHGRDGRVTRGVLGAVELVPPGHGGVLPHEQTMPKPAGERLEILQAVRANLDPVWLLSLAGGLTALLADGAEGQAGICAGCRSGDGAGHRLRRLSDPGLLAAIGERVASAPLVIADGHHRYQTALAYQAQLREAGAGPGLHDAILAFVVELDGTALTVEPIHRLLRGTGAGAEVRACLADTFTVTPAGPNTGPGLRALTAAMDDTGGLGLVDGLGLALLEARPIPLASALDRVEAPLRDVTSAWFDAALLPALAKLGPRVSYRHDAAAVAAQVAAGQADAAVLLRPVPLPLIREVAAAGLQMPPKTTYFRPKPCTGLVMRSLEP